MMTAASLDDPLSEQQGGDEIYKETVPEELTMQWLSNILAVFGVLK